MASETARVEAFSDGVDAIAITLLIVDLKVPAELSTSDLSRNGTYQRKINREGHEFHSCRVKLLFESGFSR